MMKTAVIFLFSWGLTLLLLALNASLYQSRLNAPKLKPVSILEVTNTVKRVVRYQPAVQPTEARFTWGMVESPDYPAYIANLRAIGCPERTIYDIITADVEKYYEGRREAVEMENVPVVWLNGSQLDAANLQRTRLLLELSREKSALLRQLLNTDVDAASLRLWQHEDLAGLLLGYLPAPKPERVVALYRRNLEAAAYQRETAAGVTIPADLEAEERLIQGIHSELAQILSPQEWEELRLRLAVSDREGLLKSIEMTGGELRTFAGALAAAKDPVKLVFDLEGTTTPEQAQAAEQKLAVDVKNLLGQARFVDYQRGRDQRFQEVFSLTEQNQLPKATAVKIFEIRQAVEAQAEQARQDAALTPEQKGALLEALRVRAEKAILQQLGAQVYENNSEGVAAWLAPLRPPAPEAPPLPPN